MFDVNDKKWHKSPIFPLEIISKIGIQIKY